MKKITRVNTTIMIFLLLAGFMWICSSHNAEAATFKDTKATIYRMSGSDYEDIKIPDEYATSYQIPYEPGTTYKLADSYGYVEVSETGLVTPTYRYYKFVGGYLEDGTKDSYDGYSLNVGTSTVIATNNNQTYTYEITVERYDNIYCESVITDYLNKNYNEDMTDVEKMRVICRMPCMYTYSASYSSAYSMILNGCGSCWASTDLILLECQHLGINAWARNGSKDAFSLGGQHMNALVEYNGVYYEMEAAFNKPKEEDGYRPYMITRRTSLFSYRITAEGTINVYQYDGYDTSGTLEVPQTIDGYTVTGIEKDAFSWCDFDKIVLPDTVQSIGNYAFRGCKNLKTLTIPGSVTSIGNCVFAECPLQNWKVDGSNTSYKIVDGVLYDADMKTLIACPASGNVTIPGTVTSIGDYAFYQNSSLSKITIPSNVKNVGEGAFQLCSNLKKVNFDKTSVESIGSSAFASTAIYAMTFPSTLKSLGSGIFSSDKDLLSVYFTGSAPDFTTSDGSTTSDKAFSGTSGTIDAYYIPDSSWTEEARSNHGGSLNWLAWDGSSEDADNPYAISIEDAEISLSRSYFCFDETEHRPSVVVTYQGKTLTEGIDYSVTYRNNVNAGKATAIVKGIGSYGSQKNVSFTIGKAPQLLDVPAEKTLELGVTLPLNVNVKTDVTYTSSNENILTVDNAGNVKAVGEGTAYITIKVSANDNYNLNYANCKFIVSKDAHTMEITSVEGPNDGSNRVLLHKKCTFCGKTETEEVITMTSFDLSWKNSEDGSADYSNDITTVQYEGTTLNYKVASCSPDNANNDELLVNSSDPDVIEVDADNKSLTMKKAGTATLTFQVKYNPSVKKSLVFTVDHNYKEDLNQRIDPTYTETGLKHYTCSYCGETKTEIIEKLTTKQYSKANNSYQPAIVVPSTTLTSVKNVKGRKIAIKWKANSRVNGYVVQISTNKAFTKDGIQKKVYNNRTVSIKSSKLRKKKTYYVRVCTYKIVYGRTYYSSWSNVKKVKIKK